MISATATAAHDALYDKDNQVYSGKFVRKDLPQVVKVGANALVPPFPSAALPRKILNCYDQIHG